MEQSKDLINIIYSLYDEMSKGQKLIADYIINHYDKAAFMTASTLGKIVGVSESTVVRFAIILNYDGYPKLQKALKELVRTKLTSVQRIKISANLEPSSILNTVLKADMNNIKKTIEEVDNETFLKVIDEIFNAKQIYIIGLRSAAPIVQFLGYYLNFVLDNVNVVTSGYRDIFEQLIKVDEDDLVIGISFPRYSTRTMEALQLVKDRKAKIVAITDSTISPLVEVADHILISRSDMASFVDSLVAPLSLVNALIVAVGLRKTEEISEKFSKLEDIWVKYKVYMYKDKTDE